MSDYDYEQYEEDTRPGDNSLAALRALAVSCKEAELRVQQLEIDLAKAKEEYELLADRQLPELMDELGIPSFETKDGLKISIKETVRASMGRSDAEKARALDWLDRNGFGAIVKRTVEVPFSRDSQQDAEELANELVESGYEASFSRKVESSTLRAFIVERLQAGEEVPMDLFKVFRDRRARVEL